MHFWKEYYTSDIVSILMHHIRRQVISIYLIIDDVSLDCVVMRHPL